MKNQILENITIDKLIFGGKGLATAPDGRKVIITGGCIPGSVVNVRVLKAKKSHYEGQELDVVKKSPMEIPLPEGFQLYGGAKWLTIGYADQLKIKEQQVREAFHGILKWLSEQTPLHPPLSGGQGNLPTFHPIISSPELYGYRNKVEFSWGKYISDREGVHDDFRFGFHAQGQFDRIIDCTYCALGDEEINAIFHEVDRLSRGSGFPTYDPKRQSGFWRHLVVRKGKKTGEIMLVFSVNGKWQGTRDNEQGTVFGKIVSELTGKFPAIVSIFFLENTGAADIVTGNPVLLYGKGSITEELLGFTFDIQPKSFFQVNTFGAEKLYGEVIRHITSSSQLPHPPTPSPSEKGGQTSETVSESPSPKGEGRGEVLLDLYAGTGTIGILLSKHFEKVYSVELVADASRDGEKNAERNHVKNVEFVNAKVEDFLKDWREKSSSEQNPPGSPLTKGGVETTIVIDPPRDGMHPSTLPNILSFGAKEIIYVSCNPATLARDLSMLLDMAGSEESVGLPESEASKIDSQSLRPAKYRITDITPVDMFPHTHHIETVVRLERIDR